MIKLVVVDFDDTLSMTEEACFSMENETARKLGFQPMTRQVHLKNWGQPFEQAILERLPGIDPKAFMRQFEQVHTQFVLSGEADSIRAENIDFLDNIKSSEYKLAILTSRSIQEVTHLMQKDHPLYTRVEKFYHKDNTAYLKPDPRVFDKILDEFSVKPEEAVYLGDSVSDAACAKSAGLHFIAVLESGLRTQKDFASVPVDFFATTLPEAYSYISKN